jgi:hypothetical protein
MNTSIVRCKPLFVRKWVGVMAGIAVFSVLFAGCATMGRDFDATQVTNIKIGTTTQNDLRSMFGAPWRVGIEDGRATWTYGKYCYRVFGESSTRDLVVRFDEKNVVASFTYNTTEP